MPFIELEGPPCNKNDKSLASVAGKGRSPGFYALDWLFVDIYHAWAMATFRAGAFEELFTQADNNGVKDLMPWVRDYFKDDEDTSTRQVLLILAAVCDDAQATLLPPAYQNDQRAKRLTYVVLTHYAKSVVMHQQIIKQPRPGHPLLVAFLPL